MSYSKGDHVVQRYNGSFLLSLLILIGSTGIFAAASIKNGERHITIIIPSYNNKDWYKRNLDSVFAQKYSNYHVMYIDDCSEDGTADLVAAYLEKHNKRKLVTLIRNTTRTRQLANHYNAVHQCSDWDIIVNLDGDDWFANERVLQRVNVAYTNPRVWMTYGSYATWPGDSNVRAHRACVVGNDLREKRFSASHLRTFYAWLFKNIDKQDLVDETGNFFPAAADVAIMFPMMEMAGKKHRKFIREILYIYNRANVLNIVHMQRTQQIVEKCFYCGEQVAVPTHKSSHIIRHHRKKYSQLAYPSIAGKKIV